MPERRPAAMGNFAGDPPPFKEPWHAQVFALTHALAHQGHFTWVEWAREFSAALANAEANGGPRDGSDYYLVWATTLEQMAAARELASSSEHAEHTEAWRAAYVSTPHGQPVELS